MDISPIVAVSEALFAVQTIDTEVHVYSLDEVVAEMRAKQAAAEPEPTTSDDGRPVSTVKRTRLEDMPYPAGDRRTVHHGPAIGDPNHFPDPRGQQLFRIDNKPDGSSCPVIAPSIGTPQSVSEGV